MTANRDSVKSYFPENHRTKRSALKYSNPNPVLKFGIDTA
jgi:hypothetical protein